MSARGWAKLLREDVKLSGMLELDEAQRIDAALRQLAELLGKITPEMHKALRTISDSARSDAAHEGRHSPLWGAIETTEDVIDILAALHRGPAEQQEGGR